jgi:hypothetical protein
MSFTNNPPLLVNQLPESIEFSSNALQNQETLSLMYKRIANAANTKTGGLFSLTEQFNFEQFSVDQPTNATQTFQNVYRTIFNLVALNGGNIPGSGGLTTPHNIIGLKRATLIYASCTTTAGDLFTVVFPYAYLSATDIIFTNPSPVALNSALFIAQYCKT